MVFAHPPCPIKSSPGRQSWNFGIEKKSFPLDNLELHFFASQVTKRQKYFERKCVFVSFLCYFHWFTYSFVHPSLSDWPRPRCLLKAIQNMPIKEAKWGYLYFGPFWIGHPLQKKVKTINYWTFQALCQLTMFLLAGQLYTL